MRSRVSATLMVGVVAAAVWAVGCAGGSAPDAVSAPAADASRGESLYQAQACHVCHGSHTQGGPNGPALAKLAPYWTVERIVSYLDDPQRFSDEHADFADRRTTEYRLPMPAYGHLAEDDRRALANWLLLR